MMFSENEILLNDCLLLLPDLPAASVDLIIADLPFGVTVCDWDIKLNLPILWRELERVCKKNAAMIFFATQKFATELINSNPKNFRYDLIWQKTSITGFLSAQKMPLRKHENILLFYRALPTYNPQKFTVDYRSKHKGTAVFGAKTPFGTINREITVDDGTRFPHSILDIPHDPQKTKERKYQVIPYHPTQKPVKLFEYLIRTYSNENDLVLDPTSGSGTTAVAALNTNRRFICVEKDLLWWHHANKRVADHIQKQNERLFPHEAI